MFKKVSLFRLDFKSDRELMLRRSSGSDFHSRGGIAAKSSALHDNKTDRGKGEMNRRG